MRSLLRASVVLFVAACEPAPSDEPAPDLDAAPSDHEAAEVAPARPDRGPLDAAPLDAPLDAQAELSAPLDRTAPVDQPAVVDRPAPADLPSPDRAPPLDAARDVVLADAGPDGACAPTPAGPVPDGASLYGIHFIPVLGDRSAVAPRPAWMGGAAGPRLWDVEMIHGEAYGWYLFEGGCYDNTTCGAYRALAGARVDLIVRLDDGVGGYVVPTTAAGRATWRARLEGLFDDRAGGSIARFARVFVVGNEPNICVEAGGAAGCAPASRAIAPADYAAAYRDARATLRAQAARTRTSAYALLAGPSGGGARGLGYLDEQLAQLCGDDVDGFALHAYGGADDDPDRDGTFGFSRDLRRQLASVDAACGGRFRNAGVFVTEFSRGTRRIADSDFIERVYRFLQAWNAGASNHPVVAATYFLGRGPGFDEENLTLDAPNPHMQSRAAFQRAVAARYPAGPFGRAASPAPDAGCVVCRCVAGVDNFCNYTVPADRAGCPGWEPGGFCNPPPGGSVDWVRGYNEHRARCGP